MVRSRQLKPWWPLGGRAIFNKSEGREREREREDCEVKREDCARPSGQLPFDGAMRVGGREREREREHD